MRIAVFGANGKVGSLIVNKALQEGIYVTAFVHGVSKFDKSEKLKVIQGDIYRPNDIEKAIKGSDVIVSALGSWGTTKKDVLATGMQNIIPCMRRHGIKRIVSITGSDAKFKSEKLGIINGLMRIPIKILFKKILDDGEDHLRQLKDSNLQWTVVRSPVMTEKGRKTKFVLGDIKPMPWETISRMSVAMATVDIIKNQKYIQKAPFIRRS